MFKNKFRILSIATCFTLLLSSTTFAGTWHQEGINWKYLEDSNYLTNSWVADQGNWYYLNSSGIVVTGTTLLIDGVNYTFDFSGKLIIGPGAADGWNDSTYINNAFNYSITLPIDVEISSDIDENIHFLILDDDFFIAAASGPVDEGQNLNSYLTELAAIADEEQISVQQNHVYLGGYKYIKIHFPIDSNIFVDLYCRQSGSDIMTFVTYYEANQKATVDQIINSIKRLD